MRFSSLLLSGSIGVIPLMPMAATPHDGYPRIPDVDILHYRFDITLSDTTNDIQGIATIEFIPKKHTLTHLQLDLAPEMAVEEASQDGKICSVVHTGEKLDLSFLQPSVAGQSVLLTVRYHGAPASGLHIGPNKYGSRTFCSDNWPNLAHHWLPVIDHPYDKATCEFLVTAPARYQVVSNGLKVEESNLGEGLKRTHWSQSVPIASWLYVLAAGEYSVQYLESYQGKDIATWVFPQDREAGFAGFAHPSKEVLAFFSDYVGPFAYEKLFNIQANSVSGGMEAASAILYAQNCITEGQPFKWRDVIVHEIAHQWFGNAVTEADWDDVWLSEGFATYFTSLFIEHADGKEPFIEVMKRGRQQVYEHDAKNPNYRVIHDGLTDMSKVTSIQTYQKGAWVLHMLRRQIGESAFRKGIRNYYQHHFNGNATTADFISEMQAAAGTDLTSFFQQWLYQGGNLFIDGSWHYNAKEKTLSVKLTEDTRRSGAYTTPVEIGVFPKGAAEPVIRKIELTSAGGELILPFDGEPEKVVIDPNTVLLGKWNFGRK